MTLDAIDKCVGHWACREIFRKSLIDRRAMEKNKLSVLLYRKATLKGGLRWPVRLQKSRRELIDTGRDRRFV